MTVDNLTVWISENRQQMGERAVKYTHEIIKAKLQKKKHLRCVFGAAPSQDELLQGL